MTEICTNDRCSAHNRVDTEFTDLIAGTEEGAFSAVTYVGEYAIYTTPYPTVIQAWAIDILNEIARVKGEEVAKDAVNKLPSVQRGTTVKDLFRVEHVVNVIRVGSGVLVESAEDLDGWKPGVVRYANSALGSEEAKRLHNELAVMINAGTFNGEDL